MHMKNQSVEEVYVQFLVAFEMDGHRGYVVGVWSLDTEMAVAVAAVITRFQQGRIRRWSMTTRERRSLPLFS